MDPRLVIIFAVFLAATAHSLNAGPRTSNIQPLKVLMRPAQDVVAAAEQMTAGEAKNEVDYQKILDMSKQIDEQFLRQIEPELITPPPVPKSTTTAPQSYLRSLCVNKRGMVPHPMDCRKYLDCWDGRVLEKFCPNDLVFSDLPGAFCDYLEYVDCGARPVLEQQNLLRP